MRIIGAVEELDDAYFEHVNLQIYLTFIADERLIHMSERGSDWDHVLQEAEHFGLQIDEFASAVDGFINKSTSVRDTAPEVGIGRIGWILASDPKPNRIHPIRVAGDV